MSYQGKFNMIIAHVKQELDGSHTVQSLEEHATEVAELCATFCSQIDSSWTQVGRLLGWLHDYGKYQGDFQSYIRRACGMSETGATRAPHSIVGAILCTRHYAQPHTKALAQALAYCISGHHRGLYDSSALHQELVNADNECYYRRACTDAPEAFRELLDKLKSIPALPDLMNDVDECDRPLLIRMLFSALVDADYLDTEAFMQKGLSDVRRATSIEGSRELWQDLRAMLKAQTDSFATDTEINQARAHFLSQCRAHGAHRDRGIYSLFLPTGAGKTLSSLAWALESALKHGASRIIYVIPYTSIITQTAEIFRGIFGDAYVLEHHSEINFSSDEEEERAKLLSENWDAPIIITTNVQMFESLYAHRTSRCRKLHNMCNAVIVFDEVQMFPTTHLNPMLRAIESLYAYFGANILLCTATQPVFNEPVQEQGRKDSGFYPISVTEIEDIVPYDRELFATFDRVHYHTPVLKMEVAQLAQQLSSHESVLCIVNTRADAGLIYDAIITLGRAEEEVIHLSRSMCSLHLRAQIARIRSRLAGQLPTVVVSTQLIEAGVDLDFPIVYRAHSGLDNIIQAGGRCNREGRRSRGDVYIFSLPNSRSFGELAQGQHAADYIYRQIDDLTHLNPNDPDTIRQYYRLFYERVGHFDEKKIEHLLWSTKAKRDLELDFESASHAFRLIDDEDAVDIYVPYGDEGRNILRKLSEQTFVGRQEFRTLQQLRVGVHRRTADALSRLGVLRRVQIGRMEVLTLSYEEFYSPSRGLLSEDLWQTKLLTV